MDRSKSGPRRRRMLRAMMAVLVLSNLFLFHYGAFVGAPTPIMGIFARCSSSSKVGTRMCTEGAGVALQAASSTSNGAGKEDLIQIKQELLSIVDRFQDIVAKFSSASTSAVTKLRELTLSLDNPLRVVIVGEFSAGKSTLINALVGEAVCESGLRPTTMGIESIDRDGFCFIDTPGINVAQFPEHKEAAFKEIRRADVVLLVLRAMQPFTEAEEEICKMLPKDLPPPVVVVNAWDQLDEDEDKRECISRIHECMCSIFTNSAKHKTFRINAKAAAKAACNDKPYDEFDFHLLRKYIADRFSNKTFQLQSKLGGTLSKADNLVCDVLSRIANDSGLEDGHDEELHQLKKGMAWKEEDYKRERERLDNGVDSVDERLVLAQQQYEELAKALDESQQSYRSSLENAQNAQAGKGTWPGFWDGALKGGAAGGAGGSVVPGVGTAVGGIGGAVVGGLVGAVKGSAELTNARRLEEERRWDLGSKRERDEKTLASRESQIQDLKDRWDALTKKRDDLDGKIENARMLHQEECRNIVAARREAKRKRDDQFGLVSRLSTDIHGLQSRLKRARRS